jgi:hypothetical protein
VASQEAAQLHSVIIIIIVIVITNIIIIIIITESFHTLKLNDVHLFKPLILFRLFDHY